jgi:CDP-diacylglycerol--glycerol-3-phosphate 3-phosphatidyltransferase
VQNSLINISIALILFAISSITDAFDGMLARKLNQVSEFGAFLDPLADKFLIWSVFTAFSFQNDLFIPLWLIVFIYLRDLFITLLRAYSRKKKKNFKTSFAAKAKTTFQMSAAAFILIYMFVTNLIGNISHIKSVSYSDIWKTVAPERFFWIIYLPLVLTIVTVVFTIYTAFEYYFNFKKKEINNG